MKILALIVALTLAAGPAAAGKLYKWMDKDGNVHYTDQPPPPEAKAIGAQEVRRHARRRPAFSYALATGHQELPGDPVQR